VVIGANSQEAYKCPGAGGAVPRWKRDGVRTLGSIGFRRQDRVRAILRGELSLHGASTFAFACAMVILQSMKLAQAIFFYLVCAAVTLSATPSSDDIARAVKDLGAEAFKDREAATRFLWEAGADAREALEKVRDDPDPEVSQRARRLLRNIEYGIRPDTPQRVRDLVLEFETAREDARSRIVEDLVRAGPVAYQPLAALGRWEPDPERRMATFWPLIELTGEKSQAALTMAEPSEELLNEVVALARVCMQVFPEDISPAVELVVRLADRGMEGRAKDLFGAMVTRFNAYLAKNPDDAEALNNLAWLGALTRQDLAKSTERSRRAVALRPNTAAYIDTLAELQFIQGHQKEALELMQQCRKLEPDSPYFKAQIERFEKNDAKSKPPLSVVGE
jgi:tetratricopeptide (TPR) repeat protein